MQKPSLSYTIWFSQRTGSTLLCKALAETGIAGKPNEWLQPPAEQSLFDYYGVDTSAKLQARLWESGSTSNGVFGLKFGMYEPHFSKILDIFRQFPGCPPGDCPRPAIWDHAFPNGRHIFMTRRNKVRLAVSWWKAIKTQEWHRQTGTPVQATDLQDAYLFEAINQLYVESSMREAGIQEFFSEAGIVPLTIVYEDFVQEYEETIKKVLTWLGLDGASAKITPPYFEQLADDISESWVQRFREERQRDWPNRAW